MRQLNPKTLTMLAVILALLPIITTGCVTPARSSAMIPKSLESSVHYSTSIAVQVDGGHETNPLWESDISTEAYSAALIESLRRSGLFTAVINDGSDYRLTVHLIKVILPDAGFTMTATVISEWQLTRVRDSVVVADEYMTTPFTANSGDAFSGATRARLAVEGAARANIAEGINRLAKQKSTIKSKFPLI